MMFINNKKLKVYFAGSIRGGRDKASDYKKIVDILDEYVEILDKHVADLRLSSKGEQNQSLSEIYNRDVRWIQECDFMIAEVTNPSLGVGYEIAYAESLGKKVICIYDISTNLSAMIGGNPNFELIPYKSIEELKSKLISNIKSFKN